MTAIAEYYAKVGFKTDQKSVRALDAYLASVEKRMAAMQSKMMSSLTFQSRPMTRALRDRLDEVANKVTFQIKKFDVSRKSLRESIQQAFTATSDRVPFRVSKFIVDRVRLQRALMLASRDFTVNMNPNVSGRGNGPRVYGTDRADLERLRHSQRMELERLRQQGSLARSAGFGAAAGTGLAGSHFGRLPGILGGGYLASMGLRGIGSLNQANQELISTQLTTQAVVESYGLEGQGPEAFRWLQRLGNNLGFSYMDQAQDYNSFLANALGAGQSLGGAQGIYKGFAEYQRAMGITPARQKLVMSALSQMMGKGVVSMEELRRQMAESMPGTMSVFANAYQNMLASQGRGGGLTGQAAIAALLEAVPTGAVRSAELLPFVSEEMQKRAAPKLEIAKNTSQAWQGVLANQRTDWTRIASESGLEEGQRNFFRFFSQWMKHNQDIPEKFGKWWKEFSEQFAIAGGFGDLIKMTLEGQETIIKEWLGSERVEQLRKDFDTLASAARSAAEFLGLLREEPQPAPGVPPKRGEAGYGKKPFWRFASEQVANTARVGASVFELDPAGFAGGIRDSFGNTMDYLTWNTPLGAPARKWSPHIESGLRTTYDFFVPTWKDGELVYARPDQIGDPYWKSSYNSGNLDARSLIQSQLGPLGSSTTVTIDTLSIVAPSGTDPEDFAHSVSEALESVLQRSLPGKNR